jgi:hypothetical protein
MGLIANILFPVDFSPSCIAMASSSRWDVLSCTRVLPAITTV